MRCLTASVQLTVLLLPLRPQVRHGPSLSGAVLFVRKGGVACLLSGILVLVRRFCCLAREKVHVHVCLTACHREQSRHSGTLWLVLGRYLHFPVSYYLHWHLPSPISSNFEDYHSTTLSALTPINSSLEAYSPTYHYHHKKKLI